MLVAKVGTGCVYFLLVGEVFLRFFSPQLMLPRYVCATDYGIRGNTPSQSYWHRAPEYRINIRTNSKGLRADGEIPYGKPQGMRRIMLLGDSFGMGYGVSLEDTFLARMVDSLRAAGVKCEPVNLSVSGFGTAEELVALQEEGFRYEPDLVVIAWHATDLDDNVRSNLYAIEGKELVRKNKTFLPAVKSREMLFQVAAFRWLAIHSHLYCCLRERSAEVVKFKIMPAMRRLMDLDSPESELTDEVAGTPSMYPQELAIALLSEIQRQCRLHGAELLILDIPTRHSRTEFQSTFPSDLLDRKDVFHIYSPIADFQRLSGEKLYWEKEHGHFTPLGCKIVGEGLARSVMEFGLLAGEAM